MKNKINQERIEQIKKELSFDGYVAGSYEVAGAYIQQLNGTDRLALIDELVPYNPNMRVLARLQKATQILSKSI